MYKLTVIIPVYNAMPWLPACLESVTAQTVFDAMQVVLVNDGSTDSSPAVCDEYAAAHENAVVIHQKNGGVSAARNAGLDAAEGEYLGFIDADDTVEPNYYESLLCAADEQRADFAFCGMCIMHGDKVHAVYAGDFSVGTVLRGEQICSVFARNMLTAPLQNSVCLKVIRRETVVKSGVRFPVGIKIAEDKRFVLALLVHCSCIVCAGGTGYLYREVLTSAMHTGSNLLTLIRTEQDETQLFSAIGLDPAVIKEGRGAHIFEVFADTLENAYVASHKASKPLVKMQLANEEIMSAIDPGLNYIFANCGTVYKLYALAFKKRSVMLTMFALWVQYIINRRGASK